MTQPTNRTEVIVLASAWPGETAGNSISCDSLLRLCCDRFDKVHFICLSKPPFNGKAGILADIEDWQHVPVDDHPMWRRFLRSLCSPLPAVTVRYFRAKREVRAAIDRIVESATGKLFLIVEDSPPACLLPDVNQRHPNIPTAIHSHDIMSKAFEDMGSTGPLATRLAWKLELRKIRRFEKKVFSVATQHWPITASDADSFWNRLRVQTHGVLGICMDADRYASVGPGEIETVVHVGSTNIRKWKGLVDFIQNAWPLIRREIPTARLVLAGRGTERLQSSSQNIDGMGFVDDECDLLAKGQIFINPQSSGSGLQLKSVVAMLAGRTLVSTKTGITGVAGEHGKEFVVANSMEQMGASIASLMRNPDRSRRIAVAARQLAIQSYNQQRFIETSRPLIDALVEEDGDKRREKT